MSRTAYVIPKIDYKKRRKSFAIPDQSMSIQEIVKRFVRGIPVDIIQRNAVYSDQNDHDLEKLNRMDFADKTQFAKDLRQRSEAQLDELLEADDAHRFAKAAEEAKNAAKAERLNRKKQKPDSQAGVN